MKQAGDGVRQAVVVIHGMGEQEPGDTLHRMSRALLRKRCKGGPLFVSRPDKVSNGHDARRLLAFADGSRLQTEFYEYHWAHLLPGNKLKHLAPLLKTVLFAWPWRIPKRLVVLYFVLWGFLIASLGAVGVGTFFLLEGGDIRPYIRGELDPPDFVNVWSAVVAPVLVVLIGHWLTRYLVDVARYLDPSPVNQKARDEIRRGAVELLEGLHSSGRYSRIVVVAHSLGSFIAYDALTFLWARMNLAHKADSPRPITALLAYQEIAAEALESPVDMNFYRQKQRDLWVERRRSGNPWLVTDLVSVGSPIAHSTILLVRNHKSLEDRQRRAEVPTSPPTPEEKPKGTKPEEPILYHGAPFAVTRWTNIWFKRDYFGGPVGPSFGNGVNDVEAKEKGLLQRLPFINHAMYFNRDDDFGTELSGAIALLRKWADLKSVEWVVDTRDIEPPDVHPWPPLVPWQ